MANSFLHRYGDARPRIYPVDLAEVIQIGDNLFYDTDDVKPFADATYGSLAVAQALSAGLYAGVANQAHAAAGLAGNLTVLTAGVFQFTCASATFEVGDLVGADDNAGPTALVNQQVIQVYDARKAIGRVVERVGSAAEAVKVEIYPRLQGPAIGQRTETITFGLFGDIIKTAQNVVTDYKFNQRVKIINVRYISAVVIAATDVIFTLKNGSDSLDDTLTVATAADAVGMVTSQAIVDANAYDYFDPDDALDIVSNGGCTGGDGQILVEYVVL